MAKTGTEADTERATRRRRANGEESRKRILDATVEVAGERGYEGTTINQVSARCGLPASSIYWHFKDKDELIAAVIERSFGSWLEALVLPPAEGPDDVPAAQAEQRASSLAGRLASALRESPDFLRLGLMLALERRPQEPTARTRYLGIRQTARGLLGAAIRELAPDLGAEDVDRVSLYALSAADGLFIAHEIGGPGTDLDDLFRLHAQALVAVVTRLRADSGRADPTT